MVSVEQSSKDDTPSKVDVAPTVQAPVVGGCEQYRPLLEKYSWDIRIAMAVMEAESTSKGVHCNKDAYNPEWHYDVNGKPICQGSFGLMQISCHGGQIYDPDQNIAAAWEKYKSRGWQPWGAYTSGNYVKYLKNL